MMTMTIPTIAGSDSELLERCISGDRDAFRPLVERYQSLVCSVAYSVVGDLRRSEEVAQEAFLTAWRELGTLKERERFKAWLCAIARNLAHRVIRRRETANVRLEAAEGKAADVPTPVEAAISAEEERIVWGALENLGETYREPLVLFYREGQSVARVAEDLGLSEDAVKQRLSRGREMLRAQVAAVIEGTLRRSRPGPVFTATVMAALPMALATAVGATAKAATLGAAGKAAAAPLVKAAATAGFFGAAMGVLGGLGGAALGTWATYQSAGFQKQRELLKRSAIWMALIMAVFVTPFIAMGFGWLPFRGSPRGYVLWYLTWMTGFFIVLWVGMWRMGRASQRMMASEIALGARPLPPSPLWRWLGTWEGRRWRSRRTILGLPLIDVYFADPDRYSAAAWKVSGQRAPAARGWIAIGERAYGVIFAFGNIAVGGIALGGISAGVIALGGLGLGVLTIAGLAVGVASFGGLAVGVVSLGGLAVGVGAVGGMAIGYWALGGGAIAWRAARGGLAWAHDYADGGRSRAVYAIHAGDAAARAFIEHHPFFRAAGRVMEHVLPVMGNGWVIAGWVGISLVLPVVYWVVGYRRKAGTRVDDRRDPRGSGN
jgi:zinc protease